MAYEADIVRRAVARLERRRDNRERRRFQLERELYARCPRLREVDAALRGTMADLALLAAGGKPVAADGPEIAAIRARNEALQGERARLMGSLGCDPAALDGAPACPKCRDTGWVESGMCTCLKELCAQEQLKALTAVMHLAEDQDFDRLRLDVYSDRPWGGQDRSPREKMGQVVQVCEGYARQFPRYPLQNLLLSGGTGLGKTYLSGCVAREVTRRGFSVAYDSAGNIFDALSARRFSRSPEEERQAREAARRYLNCDLLILDDLGTELTTSFVQSALYQIVNGRLLEHRSVVLSTNLRLEELAHRYGPQIASRIEGEYQILPFFGEDIRKLKKERGL